MVICEALGGSGPSLGLCISLGLPAELVQVEELAVSSVDVTERRSFRAGPLPSPT